jgi:glycerol uptake facilitator-like aquaporin
LNARAVVAEFAGSTILAATVIGSGIAAQNLSGGNVALALLANAIATGCTLYVIISIFAPLSGAHFNPAVSAAFALRGGISWLACGVYVVAQVTGMIFGAWLAHAMFELPLLQISTANRSSPGMAIGEIIATFGLILTIFGLKDKNAAQIPVAVALYITSAYWFTSSTSFANPAITIARSLSDTFAGIAPANVPVFIVCQLAGMLAAVALASWLWPKRITPPL